MRTRTAKPDSKAQEKRSRTRQKNTTVSKEVSGEVTAEAEKPSKAFATMWVAMIVSEKLDGISHPVRDMVTTKAINMGGAIKNIGAYYNHRRRVDASKLRIIMIMTFSEFVSKRMCIDYESMPMIESTSDFADLPSDVVKEIHRVSDMTRGEIDAEIKELYEAEKPVSTQRPLRPERKRKAIGETSLSADTTAPAPATESRRRRRAVDTPEPTEPVRKRRRK